MQAEHRRGNGFIISPMKAPMAIPKPRHTFHFPCVDTSFVAKGRESISSLFGLWRSGFILSTKAFLSKVLYTVVAICSVAVFFQYFAFGTAVYHNGKRIATVPDAKSFALGLSMAQTYANEHGVTGIDISFNTIPALSLKSDIIEGQNLRDNLLLCTPSFSSACTLFSGNTAVFVAENQSIAKEVSNEYLEKYSMDGDASFSAEVRYEESVMPKDKILSREECSKRLSECDALSVVSVVSSTVSKEIPYEIKTQQDESLYIGESVTVFEGKVGSAKVNYEKTYKNGMEETYKVVNEDIVAKPVAAVVRVGTKPKEVLKTGVFYPLEGVLSSPFGKRWGRVHEGIDIAVSEGTPVLAAECGTVCLVNENAGGYGKLVKIDHGYGVITAYAHLSEIQVYEGQVVNKNTRIALSGNTGRSTGPHLHFEILNGGTPLNPLDYLKKR